MNRLVVFVIAILLATTSVSFSGGKVENPKVTVLQNQTVSESASHFISSGGDDRNAGANASATGEIPGVGKATVDVSTSWDWGLYRGSETTTSQFDVNTGVAETKNPIEVEEHPCALFANTTHTFIAANSSTGVTFDTDGSVVITAANGDVLAGQTRGGYVCEIVIYRAS